MATPDVRVSPLARSRRRAETLRDRHAFVAEQLTLYLALTEVWERAHEDARATPPDRLAGWAARHVLPEVVAVTEKHGPKPLAESLASLSGADGATELLAAWLAGEELVPVERYLARTTLRGPLAAVDASAACAADPAPRGDRRCPGCGGPPQLSFRAETGDRLVSGHRTLECARCGRNWAFSATACAFCDVPKRTVYTEQGDGPQVGRRTGGTATFPHLRIESCTSCRRYLIDVDLGRDPMAVPEVDELAAVPLDLYAAEQGLTKITPNVMGF